MKKSELKILTMAAVVESNLSLSIKKKMLKFIKEEATPYQCMGFILDQKLYNLNESGIKELKRRFIQEISGKYHPYRKTFFAHANGPTASVVGGVSTGLKMAKIGGASPKQAIAAGTIGAASGIAQWAGYRLVRSAFDKCTKACGTFKINNPKRQLCLYTCKASRLEKEISALRKMHGSAAEIGKKMETLKNLKLSIEKYKSRG